MIIQLEEALTRLHDMRKTVDELGVTLNIAKLRTEVSELEATTLEPDFWSDQQRSGRILKELKQKKDKIGEYESLVSRVEDAASMRMLRLRCWPRKRILTARRSAFALKRCSAANTTAIMPLFRSIRGQAARRRRIGR